MIRIYLSLIYLFNLSHLTAHCQESISTFDSLKQIENTSGPDTSLVSAYVRLADRVEGEEAERFLRTAVALADKLQYSKGLAEAYSAIGRFSRNRSDYFQAIRYYKKAINAAKDPHASYILQTYLELGIAHLRLANFDSAEVVLSHVLLEGNTYLQASAYNTLGNVAKEKGDYQQAVDNYLKSTQLFRELNDKSGLTQSISNLGNIEVQMGNLDKGMRYAKESLEYAQESNQLSSVAYSHRLIGRIYRKEMKLDSALLYYDRAVAIYRQLGMKRDIGETNISIGNIYFEKLDFPAAIRFYNFAITTARTIPDSINMSYAYSAIGQAYLEIGRNNLSDQYMDSAHFIAVAKQLPYVELDVRFTRSWNHAGRKAFDLAFREYQKYIELRDSITRHENRVAAQELEAAYQQERSEEEIRILNAEKEIASLQAEQKAAQRNYLIGFSVLLLGLIMVLYNRYTIKKKTVQELAALDQLKSRFITNLSHEFRTPLSLLSGPLSRRIEKTTDPEEREELGMMARNASRLSTMIDQLLDLARLESGNMKLQVSPCDLSEVLSLTAASFQSLAEHKGITFHKDYDVPLAAVYFDKDKIEKVLFNLVGNAFKYTPTGGSIMLKAEVSNAQLIVSVSDSGVGIPAEEIPHVFDRFYRAEETSVINAEGTGIGLALCKELIELHRGKMWVESEAGKGSTFSFSISISSNDYTHDVVHAPVQSVKMVGYEYPLPASYEPEDLESNGQERPVVLIAEDNPDMSRFISTTLDQQYQVVTAPNGREALELAITSVPDLIITDVMMPEMDGTVFCRRVKLDQATSHVPVIMLTAKADLESRIEGLEQGADDYLTKPFESRELLVRVNNLIQLRRKLQQVFRQQIILEPKQLSEADPTERFVSGLISLVESRYSDSQFGVEQLAEAVAMSRSQLHRKLKAVTGESPGEFLRRYRLERAKQLLGSGGYSVADVAFKTGFNNVPNFSKAFKDYTGVTPSAYSNETAGSA